MKKTVLLTGGLGYIGSTTAYVLNSLGYDIVIVDSLIYNQSINLPWAHVIKGDIGNVRLLDAIFGNRRIDAVMHFAGLIEVGESVKRPDAFYHTNVVNSLKLLEVMRRHDVMTFVFSSSCAVYGTPITVPMDEQHPYGPVSPYGKTKMAVEGALQDYAAAFGLRSAALRYFNAAGALPDHGIGECHNPETHIIPLLLRAVLDNKPFPIFGTDYQTSDGTCVRDYVHVLDIARAHVLALDYLATSQGYHAFNLGTGIGYTVRQLIEAAQRVCGVSIKIEHCARRPGDAPVLVANAEKAKTILGWQPERSSLETMLHDAWIWEQLRYEARNGLKAVSSTEKRAPLL